MNITVVSDLHADFQPIHWKQTDTQILIVAGDTANDIGFAAKSLNNLTKYYDLVLTVDGNHESYAVGNQNRYTVEDTARRLDDATNEKVIVLGNTDSVEPIDGVCYIGTNGWYAGLPDRWNQTFWNYYMNDDKACGFTKHGLTPINLALKAVFKLKEQLRQIAAAHGRTVVVTHTAPLVESLENRPWDNDWQSAGGFYYNYLMKEILEEYTDIIDLWIHGHVHFTKDYMFKNTRIVCNPRGYRGENPGWSPQIITF